MYNAIGDALLKFKQAGVKIAPILEEFGLEAETEPPPIPPGAPGTQSPNTQPSTPAQAKP
jgi:hypothetical protein